MIVLCMPVLFPSVVIQWKIQLCSYIRSILVNYNDGYAHTLDKCLTLAIAYQINRLWIEIKRPKRKKDGKKNVTFWINDLHTHAIGTEVKTFPWHIKTIMKLNYPKLKLATIPSVKSILLRRFDVKTVPFPNLEKSN